ncbi:MAG: hypothetical protein ABIZ81_18555 [Opitutaceae bacterium]
MSKRKEHKVLLLAREFAAHPFVRSDYSLPDENGRTIEYLLIEGFVFGYWLDHSVRELRIVEIHSAS